MHPLSDSTSCYHHKTLRMAVSFLVGDARSPSCTLKQPLLIWFELSLHATRVSDGCLMTETKLVQCTRSLNGSWKRRERTPIQVDVLLFHLGDQQYL